MPLFKKFSERIKKIAKTPTKIYFHSASVPQQIEIESQMLHSLNQSATSLPKSTKNYKYQFYILYYQPKKSKQASNDASSSEAKKQYVIKQRKIVLGKANVKDLSDGLDQTNPLTVKSMRSRNKASVIASESFDKEKALARGGFFNREFWKANLLWGPKDDFMENFNLTTKLVKEMIPEAEINLLDLSPIVADNVNESDLDKPMEAIQTAE